MDLNDSRTLDAEVSVLGSVLISPEIVGDMMLRVHAADFSVDTYRRIFDAIRRLWMQQAPIDAVTVLNALGSKEYERVLIDLMNATPTAANWAAYAQILAEQGRLRRMKSAALRLTEAATIGEAEAALEEASRHLSPAGDEEKTVTFAAGLSDFYERQAVGKPPAYLSFGVRQLDTRLYIEAGDFVILGGYPSAGKTAFATQLAFHMAKTHRVGFFSLETNPAKIYDRILAQAGRIDFRRIKGHALELPDYNAASAMLPHAGEIHLDVIRASGYGAAEIQAAATAKRYDVIFIDYVQLLRAEGKTRVEQVTNISLALHTMAQRCGITVIALSQLSRPEKGAAKTRTPRMSDLRESGQLEQDADAIMVLQAAPNGSRNLSIIKNKEGECGVIRLSFDAAHLSFQPLSDRKPEDDEEDDEDELPDMWQRRYKR